MEFLPRQRTNYRAGSQEPALSAFRRPVALLLLLALLALGQDPQDRQPRFEWDPVARQGAADWQAKSGLRETVLPTHADVARMIVESAQRCAQEQVFSGKVRLLPLTQSVALRGAEADVAAGTGKGVCASGEVCLGEIRDELLEITFRLKARISVSSNAEVEQLLEGILLWRLHSQMRLERSATVVMGNANVVPSPVRNGVGLRIRVEPGDPARIEVAVGKEHCRDAYPSEEAAFARRRFPLWSTVIASWSRLQLIAAAKEDLRNKVTAERQPRLPLLLRRLADLNTGSNTLAELCAEWGLGDGFAYGPGLILDSLLQEKSPDRAEAGRCLELAWRSRKSRVAEWVAARWFRLAQEHGLDVRGLAWEWLSTRKQRQERYASPSRDAVAYLRGLTLTAEQQDKLAAIEAELASHPNNP